jgi:hypothetical protein
LGHKWIFGQSKKDDNGYLQKRILRCNGYREPKQTHLPNIDPSDFREGKSGRTGCGAHVNIVRLAGPAPHRWHITLVDGNHNHEQHVPEGGNVQRPPTAAHRLVVERFADNFSRRQIGDIINSQFTNNTLEPRQISNMRNKARKEAREAVDALGGDFAAILASLEEKNRTEPGWDYAVQIDEQNTLITIWWQSPTQKQLTRRYADIIINDNSYNRNDKQYPLSIGIVIDSGARSCNCWYALQQKEDTETHSWILRCHLKASGDVHPEIFLSDRSGALIAAVAQVMVLTFHIYCLSHLLENVDKNLARTLGADWLNFLHDFWACYRAVSPEHFEELWAVLVGNYPAARTYLHDLHQVRDRWAWAWISVIFTAGIRTNGRVEAENRVTKALTGPKKTLFQVFNALNDRTLEQHKDDLIRVREVGIHFMLLYIFF